MRGRATEALAAFAREGSGPDTLAVLERIARNDAIAYVRESAVRALRAAGDAVARKVLEAVAASDPEPRVRRLASALLGAPDAARVPEPR